MLITRSTFEYSDAVESMIELVNAIESGFIYDLPIEQRLDALYAGCSVVNCLTKRNCDLFTEEEQELIISAHRLILSEIAEMGIGS